MFYSIHFSPEAIDHLSHFVEYYNSQVNNLGIEFYHELKHGIDTLQHFPKMYQIKHKNKRILYNLRFKTNVVYAVDEALRKVIVLAVVRSETNPNNWKSF